jgi:hypothetical protein
MFLEWLQSTAFAQWVDQSGWGYPLLLTLHGLGMAMVAGLTVVVGLRVLGFPAKVPLGAYRATLPFLIWGFVVNASTGVALFVHDAVQLFHNISYQAKMISIVVGLVVLWRLYATTVGPAAKAEAAGAEFVLPRSAKPLAIAAILVWWLSVIVSGRLVAYLAPPA